MNTINIKTTQNVNLEYEVAGVGYRILAALLDGVFIGVYVGIIMLCFGLGVATSKNLFNDHKYLMLTLLILLSLPVLLYHFISETFMNGQSLGKKILGIKVVKTDGSQPGISSYMLRSLFRVIDIQLLNGLIAVICIPVSEKSQRLGDMAAGTTVIKKDVTASLRDTILYRQVTNYNIVFEQVALLSDKDIAIIKDILDHSIENNKNENLILLSEKVKNKMGITTNLNDVTFLKTVLLDYSHFQFNA